VGESDRPAQVIGAGTVPRIRPLWWIALVVFGASVVIGAVYLANGRPKHAIAFFGLAVVAAVGVWFTSGPRPRTPE
jgi:hypothetical protein